MRPSSIRPLRRRRPVQLLYCYLCSARVRSDNLEAHIARVHKEKESTVDSSEKQDDTAFLNYLSDKNLRVFTQSGKPVVRDAARRILACRRRTAQKTNRARDGRGSNPSKSSLASGATKTPASSTTKQSAELKSHEREPNRSIDRPTLPYISSNESNLQDWDFD